MVVDRADAERTTLGIDVTGSASRGLNPGSITVGILVGVKRSDGRVTVARVDHPLPSTAPGFVHVTLDSAGSYKDVPMDQLYTICLGAHIPWTGGSGAHARIAPVQSARPCLF